MSLLVFDIETVPDVSSGKRLYGLEDLQEVDVAELMFSRRRQESNGRSEFLPHHLHRVVAIAVVLLDEDGVKVESLGKVGDDEAALVRCFFQCIESRTPTLVSWNGSGFDLPVLHYRSLLHGISAARYWEDGSEDRDFRWNNYLSRYHQRHTDLMEVLSAYQNQARASLNDIAIMLGLPGKMGMSGDQVWECYQSGDMDAIRNYCETDVLNTYLIYLRYQLIRGHFQAARYERGCDFLAAMLGKETKPHLRDFLKAWRG